MEWLLLAVTTLLAVEVFVRTSFKQNINAILAFSKRSLGTLSSKQISDHWKEKVLLRYSLEIFKNSVLLIVCFIFTATVIFVAHVIGSYLGMNLLSLFMTPLGMIVSLLLALLYVYFRGRIIHGRV